MSCLLSEAELLIVGDMKMGMLFNRKKRLEHWRVIALLLVLFDMIAASASYLVALWIRFDCSFTEMQQNGEYLIACLRFLPIYALICVAVFYWHRLYNSIWRFASFNELMRVGLASVITTLIHIVGIGFFYGVEIGAIFARMPLAYYPIGACLQFMLTLGIRFSYRFVEKWPNRRAPSRNIGYASASGNPISAATLRMMSEGEV